MIDCHHEIATSNRFRPGSVGEFLSNDLTPSATQEIRHPTRFLETLASEIRVNGFRKRFDGEVPLRHQSSYEVQLKTHVLIATARHVTSTFAGSSAPAAFPVVVNKAWPGGRAEIECSCSSIVQFGETRRPATRPGVSRMCRLPPLHAAKAKSKGRSTLLAL